MIDRNHWRGDSDQTAGAARAGRGLLAGLLRCGRCGRKLYVRYWGTSGTSARYLCSGDYHADGGRYCLGFGGATVDRRFGEEVVRVLSPLGVRASLAALNEIGSELDDRRRALARQIEQLEYEAARASEQYHHVDARNRLVASELERRWNDKLEALGRARASLVEFEAGSRPVSAEQRAAIVAFGERFSDVWNHAACPIELKKQIVRTVIEEVLVDENPPGRLSFIVHWKGGSHTAFEMEKANPKTVSKTADDDVEVVRKMAPRYGDDVIAKRAQPAGATDGKGQAMEPHRRQIGSPQARDRRAHALRRGRRDRDDAGSGATHRDERHHDQEARRRWCVADAPGRAVCAVGDPARGSRPRPCARDHRASQAHRPPRPGGYVRAAARNLRMKSRR